MNGFHKDPGDNSPGNNNSTEEISNDQETTTDSESYQSSNSQDSEPEEDNFWKLLIEEMVANLESERMAQGIPIQLEGVANIEELTDGKNLGILVKKLRETHANIKCISEASLSDPLLEMIENKSFKIQQKIADTDTADEADEIAWKKFKPMIKKKILKNAECFSRLLENDNESDNSDEDTNCESDLEQ